VRRIDRSRRRSRALHLALDKPIAFQAGQYVQLEIPGLGRERGVLDRQFARPMSSAAERSS
jgi:NAD(P)H-flavin reductase